MIKASEESKNNIANEDRWKEEGRKWKLVTERKVMEGGNDKGNRTEGREGGKMEERNDEKGNKEVRYNKLIRMEGRRKYQGSKDSENGRRC